MMKKLVNWNIKNLLKKLSHSSAFLGSFHDFNSSSVREVFEKISYFE